MRNLKANHYSCTTHDVSSSNMVDTYKIYTIADESQKHLEFSKLAVLGEEYLKANKQWQLQEWESWNMLPIVGLCHQWKSDFHWEFGLWSNRAMLVPCSVQKEF